MGHKIYLKSDHKALERLNKGPLKSARLQRWHNKLQEYNFELLYVRPQEIPHVDALSRAVEEINTLDEKKTIKIMEEH